MADTSEPPTERQLEEIRQFKSDFAAVCARLVVSVNEKQPITLSLNESRALVKALQVMAPSKTLRKG